MAVSLAIIIILGLCADYLFRALRLPGLVGMLLVGVLAGPFVWNLMSPEMMAVSADFRKIALIVILLRAGFELRRDTLNRVGRAALVMSALPALLEILAVFLIAPPLLGLTPLEAAILGAILAAVSPAVVVPLMIDFMDRGRGTGKGIPTLLLGASSVDDVFVIVLFTAFLSMHGGGEPNLWVKMGEVPVSILLAVAVLSILLTAPLGAVGITVLGDRFLDHGTLSPYKFKEIREKFGLPHVGERVRNKRFGSVWKIIEQREIWLESPSPAPGGVPGPMPALFLRFWKEGSGRRPGTGKTLSYRYTQSDASFQDHWEILYDG